MESETLDEALENSAAVSMMKFIESVEISIRAHLENSKKEYKIWFQNSQRLICLSNRHKSIQPRLLPLKETEVFAAAAAEPATS